ncbi:protein of unknown function [Hyphomicrobium sp. 1Nfss2.1]
MSSPRVPRPPKMAFVMMSTRRTLATGRHFSFPARQRCEFFNKAGYRPPAKHPSHGSVALVCFTTTPNLAKASPTPLAYVLRPTRNDIF